MAKVYNSEALDATWGQIESFGFVDSRRNQLVSAYVSIMLEHQSAIRLLLDNGIAGSAGALLRSQIEAAFRGLWVAPIGTDTQLEQIIEKDKEPFPRLERSPACLIVVTRLTGSLRTSLRIGYFST